MNALPPTPRSIVATIHPFSGGPATFPFGGIDPVTLGKGPAAAMAPTIRRAREWRLGGVYIDITPKVAAEKGMAFSFGSLWSWAHRHEPDSLTRAWARGLAGALWPELRQWSATRLAYVGSPFDCPVLATLTPGQVGSVIAWTLDTIAECGFNTVGIDASSMFGRDDCHAWHRLVSRHGLALYVEASPAKDHDWFDGLPVIQPSGQFRRWSEGRVPEIVAPSKWPGSSIIAYGEAPDEDVASAPLDQQLRFLAHAACGHGVRAGMGISHWTLRADMMMALGLSEENQP